MGICSKTKLQILCVLLSAVLAFLTTARAKPTLSFQFPQSFSSFTSLTEQFVRKRSATLMKSYSGSRISNDSLIMIYHHDRTVAVTELGPNKLLLGCELIEIYNDDDGKTLLDNLAKLNRPLEISFKEMLKLMDQCDTIDKMHAEAMIRRTNQNKDVETTGIIPSSPFVIFSGIIPGTKWCGAGDVARNYYDLGQEEQMDRCCRTHDLCPIKVRAYQQRYELMNDSVYTKSHCTCDDMLYSCLKDTNTTASQVMGSFYFNIIQVPCLQMTNSGYEFRGPKNF
ncbi:uncharacterized protein LOC129605285 [Condylostylus longicornis]|uniref:uncharacterized protein LOC129605285 n=1 Tax=Condylostylus longicornis TaxID=2530218 RepID=UPI00244DF2BC|nr:uncharacterized protein LOC129605285 [Condylostylus longicornis]